MDTAQKYGHRSLELVSFYYVIKGKGSATRDYTLDLIFQLCRNFTFLDGKGLPMPDSIVQVCGVHLVMARPMEDEGTLPPEESSFS